MILITIIICFLSGFSFAVMCHLLGDAYLSYKSNIAWQARVLEQNQGMATTCANREPSDKDKGLLWIHRTAADTDIIAVYVKMYGTWRKFENTQ